MGNHDAHKVGPRAVGLSLADRHRVLLAEDHPVNQKVAARMLEDWGISVVIAANGRKAIERSIRSFDVVLMDVQMPEMDGFEALQAIREGADIERRSIPVVALTAHAMNGDRDRCLAAGFDAYLAKPSVRPSSSNPSIK